MSLPQELVDFISNEKRIYAKTMPKWPHKYIVRGNVDESLFVKLVEYIRTHGYLGSFYKKEITYYDNNNLVYWTMGADISETTIINRCMKESTYEYRLEKETLPN